MEQDNQDWWVVNMGTAGNRHVYRHECTCLCAMCLRTWLYTCPCMHLDTCLYTTQHVYVLHNMSIQYTACLCTRPTCLYTLRMSIHYMHVYTLHTCLHTIHMSIHYMHVRTLHTCLCTISTCAHTIYTCVCTIRMPIHYAHASILCGFPCTIWHVHMCLHTSLHTVYRWRERSKDLENPNAGAPP